MAGVARPMIRASPRHGLRFLVGLTAGMMMGALVLSLAVYLVGMTVAVALSHEERLLGVATICLALGLADMTNRTPQVWRQVPQRLMKTLPPGTLGAAWGFDLQLLFTTQKETSLIWASLVAALLVEPSAAPYIVLAAFLGFFLIFARRALSEGGETFAIVGKRRLMRMASGTILILLCLSAITQAL
jgi:hypothetical protein